MNLTEIKRITRLFADQTDEHGNLAHPHFDDVRKVMGALIEWHPELMAMPDGNPKLERAYQLALRTFAAEDETNAMIRKAIGGVLQP